MSLTNSKIRTLLDAGGMEWRKDKMHRIYFNRTVVCMIIGLEIHRYKTGNISYAALNGEQISNGKATRLLNSIGKVWYDCNRPDLGIQTDNNLGEFDEIIVNGFNKKFDL